jgi:hypothetical protein
MDSRKPRLDLTREELEAHLTKQIGFLRRSADAFDAGYTDEATRMAQVLRILFHDKGPSHSLLGQLGIKNKRFLDTSPPMIGGNELAEVSLVHVGIGGAGGQKFIAPLSDVLQKRLIPGVHWWEQIVIRNRDSHVFSRSRLALTMANQDGGAHVDPSIDREYREIAEGALGYQFLTDGVPVTPNDVMFVTIRQIAHEVLSTLVVDYRPERKVLDVGIIVLQSTLFKGVQPKKHSPNKPCPCNSGLKYKKCHGSLPLE